MQCKNNTQPLSLDLNNRQMEKCLHMVDMEKYDGEKYIMWRHSSHERYGDKYAVFFFSQFMLFCPEICFVAIYAVLLQKIFCRDLHAFV